MQTLGSTIKQTREKKGFSIQDISAKTNIIPSYIEAIENDDFTNMPAEVYIRGFLRNISLALDLDSDEMLALYKNRDVNSSILENNKLLEEYVKPIVSHKKNELFNGKSKPKTKVKKTIITEMVDSVNVLDIADEKMDPNYLKQEHELLLNTIVRTKKSERRQNKIKIILLIFVVVIVLFFASLYFFHIRNTNNSQMLEQGISRERNIVDSYAKIGVRVGDVIYFKPIGLSATLEFINIDTSVEARINDFEVRFSASEPLLADLNKNGIDDFKITLVDIVDNVAMIEIEQIDEVLDSSSSSIFDNTNFATSAVTNTITSDVQVIDGDMYILQNVSQIPIVVECSAKRFVYIRYFIDDGKPNTTNLSSGKSITITAQDVIMLTIGNASEVVLKINDKHVVFGSAGETVNKTIKWIKNPDNSTKFDLIVTDTK